MSYRSQSAPSVTAVGAVQSARSPRLLDEVRRCLRVKHYSIRTEAAYVAWIKRFILANGKRQALSALLFVYRNVLGVQLPWLENVVRAKSSRRVPTVCRSTREGVGVRPLLRAAQRVCLSRAGGLPRPLIARLATGWWPCLRHSALPCVLCCRRPRRAGCAACRRCRK